MIPVLEENSTNCLKWIRSCSWFAHLITVQVVKDALHMYQCQAHTNVHVPHANQNKPSLTAHLFNLYYVTTMSICLSVCCLSQTCIQQRAPYGFVSLGALETSHSVVKQNHIINSWWPVFVCCSWWYGTGLAIMRSQVWTLNPACGYCVVCSNCQLNVPSIRGWLMSTSKSWGVNG